jgi:hypothetical protein
MRAKNPITSWFPDDNLSRRAMLCLSKRCTIISFTHFLVYQETSVIPGRAVSRQAAKRDYFADFIIHLSVFGQSG